MHVYITYIDVDITISKQPKDLVVPIGEELRLVCRATNPHNKNMKYEWFLIQANGGTCMHDFCT